MALGMAKKQSKKEGNPAICDNMDEPGGNCAKWKTSDRKPQRDFPGGPVAKTLCSQYRGLEFDPWSRNQIPYATTKSSGATTKTQSSQIIKYFF